MITQAVEGERPCIGPKGPSQTAARAWILGESATWPAGGKGARHGGCPNGHQNPESYQCCDQHTGCTLGPTGLDNKVKGTQFEHIVKWYLENDPYYGHELVRVDLWADSPHRWKKADCGIDLIAEHRDGTLWAIQAKAYAPDYYITKKDVDTSLTESSSELFAFRLLVGTTDHVAPNAEDAIKRQLIPVGRRLRTDLEEAQVIWPASPEESARPEAAAEVTAASPGRGDHRRDQRVQGT